MKALRPYQNDIVNRVREAYLKGYKSPCVVLPCGGGKSVIVAEIARRTTAKNNHVLFLVLLEESIAKQAVVYRGTRFQRFRLSQVAGYFCAIELAAVKYAAHEQTATDERFFGGSQNLKKNWLKQARRMRLE